MDDVDVDEVLLELTNDFDIHKKLLQAVDVFYRGARKCEAESDQARKNYCDLRMVVFRACQQLRSDWSHLDKVKTTILTEDVFCHYWEHVSRIPFVEKVRLNFRNVWSPSYCRDEPEAFRGHHQPAESKESDSVKYTTKLGRIDFCPIVVDYSGSISEEVFKNHPQPTKGIEMSQAIATQKLIDTRTYINGVESSQVTDEKIFNMISNYESEIENLKKIKNQPKALKAKVQFMQSQIDELVAFVDGRLGDPV